MPEQLLFGERINKSQRIESPSLPPNNGTSLSKIEITKFFKEAFLRSLAVYWTRNERQNCKPCKSSGIGKLWPKTCPVSVAHRKFLVAVSLET
jgi:hypothetical protein